MKKTILLDDPYLDKLQDISYTPVFILGLHRSGTTILYKMLGETNNFNIVKAYHILKYDELLYNHINSKEKESYNELNNYFKEMGVTNRRIDKMKINADFPQEYVYLFERKKFQNRLSDKNFDLFDTFCKKINFISDESLPILLKNPYDFPNFIYIKKKLPSAKFIFIHRNPLNVISSTIRAWFTLYEKKNPYTAIFSPKYSKAISNPFIFRFMRFIYCSSFPIGIFNILRNSKKSADYFLNNIEYLLENDYLSISYEELCKKPNKTINKIMEFLNISTNIDFKEFIKERKLEISPVVKRFQESIKRKMNNYFKYLENNLYDR